MEYRETARDLLTFAHRETTLRKPKATKQALKITRVQAMEEITFMELVQQLIPGGGVTAPLVKDGERDSQGSGMESDSNFDVASYVGKNLDEYWEQQENEAASFDIHHLTLTDVHFNGRRAAILAEAIQKNGTLISLSLQNCKVRKPHFEILCKSLYNDNVLASIQLTNLNILADQAKELASLIKTLPALTSLDVSNCGIGDQAMIQLAQGLTECKLLEKLDIRSNLFEYDGFVALFNALKNLPELKKLCLSEFTCGQKEFDVMINCFQGELQRIHFMTLDEVDIDVSDQQNFLKLLTSMQAMNELEHISFSKIDMRNFKFENYEVPHHLVKLVNTLPELHALSLCHCDLNSEEVKVLCEGFGIPVMPQISMEEHSINTSKMSRKRAKRQKTTASINKSQSIMSALEPVITCQLRYLDLAWNQMGPECMDLMCLLINKTPRLQKLLLQHNNFGTKPMKQLGECLQKHPSIAYLDVSANHIKAKGLQLLFDSIIYQKHQLHTLQCRKNHIEGDEIKQSLDKLSQVNTFLRVLNLSHNNICTEAAMQLMEYTKKNFCIEELLLNQNPEVLNQVATEIAYECKQNILIREHILPKLPSRTPEQTLKFALALTFGKNDVNELRKQVQSQFLGYDLSDLSFVDTSVHSTDFIFKFIGLGKSSAKSLVLKEVHTDKKMACLVRNLTLHNDLEFQILKIVNCPVSKKAIQGICKQVKNLPRLKELQLTKLQGLSNCLDDLKKSLKKSKTLQVLNLTENSIQQVYSIASLLEANQVLRKVDLRGNPLKQSMFSILGKSLKKNISMQSLLYDERSIFSNSNTNVRSSVVGDIQPIISQKGSDSGDSISSSDYTQTKNEKQMTQQKLPGHQHNLYSSDLVQNMISPRTIENANTPVWGNYRFSNPVDQLKAKHFEEMQKRISKSDQDTALAIHMIQEQLALNKNIYDDILRVTTQCKHCRCSVIRKTKEQVDVPPDVLADMHIVDLTGFQNINMDALIKFISYKQIRILILKDTYLTARDIMKLAQEISQNKVPIEQIDLSENLAVNDEVAFQLCWLFSNKLKIKSINLSKTAVGNFGLLSLVKSSKRSTSIHDLQFNNCKIDLSKEQDQGELIQALNKACALSVLELEGNNVPAPFLTQLGVELKKNIKINKLILPQLQKQIDVFKLNKKLIKNRVNRSKNILLPRRSNADDINIIRAKVGQSLLVPKNFNRARRSSAPRIDERPRLNEESPLKIEIDSSIPQAQPLSKFKSQKPQHTGDLAVFNNQVNEVSASQELDKSPAQHHKRSKSNNLAAPAPVLRKATTFVGKKNRENDNQSQGSAGINRQSSTQKIKNFFSFGGSKKSKINDASMTSHSIEHNSEIFESVKMHEAKKHRTQKVTKGQMSIYDKVEMHRNMTEKRRPRSIDGSQKTSSLSQTETSSDSNTSMSSMDSKSSADSSDGSEQVPNLKLNLVKKDLRNLDFLCKFLREFPNIKKIDLQKNNISNASLEPLIEIIKKNRHVIEVDLNGNFVFGNKKNELKAELQINQKIHKIFGPNINSKTKNDGKTLDLSNSGLTHLNFLYKIMEKFTDIEELNLRGNLLGNDEASQLTGWLTKNENKIRSLNLQDNKIGTKGLQMICSNLAHKESKLQVLDIQNNMIPEGQLKTILVLLLKNQSIKDIKYSLQSQKAKDRKQRFDEISHLSVAKCREILLNNPHKDLKCWQKAILPYWFAHSFIHAKHEAFSFKYDTKSLVTLEEKIMKPLGYIQYANAAIYFMFLFVFPELFANECGEGINIISHYCYAAYTLCNMVFEVSAVLIIQATIKNKQILSFNRWHVVELFMGQIARFDTYLDVCFLALMIRCQEWNLAIPITVFIVIFLTYPIITLIKTLTFKSDYNHTLPNLERNCQLSFLRENMLLATVLDSFCIDNFQVICGKPFVMGKIIGTWTFFTQDLPQLTIHLIFLFFIHNNVSHADLTVELSLVCSSFAVCISFFNFTMFQPNDFDPILLQIELKRRQEEKINLQTSALRDRKLASAIERGRGSKLGLSMSLINKFRRRNTVNPNLIDETDPQVINKRKRLSRVGTEYYAVDAKKEDGVPEVLRQESEIRADPFNSARTRNQGVKQSNSDDIEFKYGRDRSISERDPNRRPVQPPSKSQISKEPSVVIVDQNPSTGTRVDQSAKEKFKQQLQNFQQKMKQDSGKRSGEIKEEPESQPEPLTSHRRMSTQRGFLQSEHSDSDNDQDPEHVVDQAASDEEISLKSKVKISMEEDISPVEVSQPRSERKISDIEEVNHQEKSLMNDQHLQQALKEIEQSEKSGHKNTQEGDPAQIKVETPKGQEKPRMNHLASLATNADASEETPGFTPVNIKTVQSREVTPVEQRRNQPPPRPRVPANAYNNKSTLSQKQNKSQNKSSVSLGPSSRGASRDYSNSPYNKRGQH